MMETKYIFVRKNDNMIDQVGEGNVIFEETEDHYVLKADYYNPCLVCRYYDINTGVFYKDEKMTEVIEEPISFDEPLYPSQEVNIPQQLTATTSIEQNMQLIKAVQDGVITPEQFKQITGVEYTL